MRLSGLVCMGNFPATSCNNLLVFAAPVQLVGEVYACVCVGLVMC